MISSLFFLFFVTVLLIAKGYYKTAIGFAVVVLLLGVALFDYHSTNHLLIRI